MSTKLIDLTGRQFGRLTVIARTDSKRLPSGQPQSQWACRCQCGVTATVLGRMLRDGKTTSCGCFHREQLAERSTKHGCARVGRKTSEYSIWCDMIKRCSNPNHSHYRHYGGRGITVCDKWRNDFTAFLNDIGSRPDGMSLARINTDGNYEPANVRWATNVEQARNKRSNRRLEWGGRIWVLEELAQHLRIPSRALWHKLRRHNTYEAVAILTGDH